MPPRARPWPTQLPQAQSKPLAGCLGGHLDQDEVVKAGEGGGGVWFSTSIGHLGLGVRVGVCLRKVGKRDGLLERCSHMGMRVEQY